MEWMCEKDFYMYMGQITFSLLFLSLNRALKTAELAEDMQQNWELHAWSYEISFTSDTLWIFISFFVLFSLSNTENLAFPEKGPVAN